MSTAALWSSTPLTAGSTRRYRPDIQYLRAIAVGTVVIFHVFPAILPGGYIGVDVFFVISGFLITGHLLDEAIGSGRIRLTRFWARRIRRLLPAAFTVIAATLAASWFLLPRETLRTIAEQAVASALYVENWALTVAAVDYLDAENDPTPFQHFWSLSVEEQFYLVWPLLIIAAVLVIRHGTAKGRLSAVGATLGAVVLLSLAASLVLTTSSPEQAYFATHARAWEFGIGGLVAWGKLRVSKTSLGPRPRRAMWWGGVGAVLVAAIIFDDDTPFPGAAAILPVLGTAVSLAAGLPGDGRAQMRRLGLGIERIGEWSYSIYLWHWPIIVIALAHRDAPIGPLMGAAVLAAVVVLSAATERWVERPFRHARAFAQPRKAVAILLVGSALVVIPSVMTMQALSAQAAAEKAAIEQKINELGANRSDEEKDGGGFAATVEPTLYPSPATRLDDTDKQYRCYAAEGESFELCGFGAKTSAVRIALVGDSHASSWVPALLPIIEERGWRLDVFAGSGCQLVPEPACAAGDDMVQAIVSGDYDVVLTAAWRQSQAGVDETVADWQGFLDRGLPIVPIVDVPHFPEETDRCLTKAADAFEAERCWTTADEAAVPDAYGRAGEQLGLPVIDLTPEFCREERCPAVIGNVIVYRDSPYSHITATFSRSLSAAVGEQLIPVVEGATVHD